MRSPRLTSSEAPLMGNTGHDCHHVRKGENYNQGAEQ